MCCQKTSNASFCEIYRWNPKDAGVPSDRGCWKHYLEFVIYAKQRFKGFQTGITCCFSAIIFLFFHAAQIVFHVVSCQHADQCWARSCGNTRPVAFDIEPNQNHGQLASCRTRSANEWRRQPRRCHVGPWSRGREVALGVLRPSLNPAKESDFFSIGEASRIYAVFFLHASDRKCVCVSFYQTSGRSAPATYQQPLTSPLHFRVHGAVVGFCRSVFVEDGI